jgi:hypothetical protein
MNTWQLIAVALGLAALPVVVYLLHRLCLFLEARGYLFYLHRKPDSSAAASFVALQKIVEPRMQHVLETEDEANNTIVTGEPLDRKTGSRRARLDLFGDKALNDKINVDRLRR